MRQRMTIYGVSLLVSVGIAGLIAWFTKWPFWGCWLLVAGAMVVNGVVADWEDTRPGGFNNPHPRD